jgi:hypothetical protein
MEKIVAIAEGYGTYHCQLEGAEGAPLSDQAYSAAGVYCYYNRVQTDHEVFQYLGENKAIPSAEVKAKYLVTADGSAAFHVSQLLKLCNFPVSPGQIAATPPQLPPSVAAPMRRPGDSPMANAQSQNLLEPEEEEKEPDPQPHNPYRRATIPLAQPTPETEPQIRNRTDPSEPHVLAPTGNARPVIQRICNILEDLVSLLFLQICDFTNEDQLVQTANAKLEAALEKKATLDMGQALDNLLAKEPTVAQENMEGLVQSIVQRQLKNDEKRKKNEIVKEALKKAQKQSSGREKGKNAKRNKQRNDKPQKEQTKHSVSPSQSPKHVNKKHSSNDPDKDYAQWRHWQQFLNWSQGPPYHTPPDSHYYPPGQGSCKGRGQGRGQGCGGSKRGQERGRGRS